MRKLLLVRHLVNGRGLAGYLEVTQLPPFRLISEIVGLVLGSER